MDHEIVVANDDGELTGFAVQNNFKVLSKQSLTSLGITVARLSPPPGMSLPEAKARLSAALPNASVDFNHVYSRQASMTLPAPDFARNLIGWSGATGECGGAPVKLGMLDTLAKLDSSVLAGAAITQQPFLDSTDAALADMDHGSIVAAILAGQDGFGLLPRAALSIAGIFTLDDDDTPIASATAFIAGLDWLAGRGVKTVNTSLSGPHNALMELAVKAANSQGMRIVAAVGNDGLDEVDRYPASYPGVVGVTAVDAEKRRFALANTGSFVSFAAPGVDLWVPTAIRSDGSMPADESPGILVSGTSFATPFVTAALAASGNDIGALTQAAVDLGEKGRDSVFGYGLVQASNTCAVTLQ